VALRVGLLGARRVREGLGPFFARDLAAAGAEVACFLVTTAESARRAAAELARTAGVHARGYLQLDEMLARERLDALAICTPHETHGAFLEAALAAGLHALCEKPLLWGGDGLAVRAQRLVRGFAERGLLLRENCQWPFVLGAFERLHPGSLTAPPRRFRMSLEPPVAGASMLADSLPHPLSLLQALVPEGEPSLAGVHFAGGAGGAVRLDFGYRAGRHEVAVEIALTPSRPRPRQVRIEIDGRGARRVVSSDYRLALADDGREVPLDDPLTQHVAAFVADAAHRAPEPSEGARIAARMRLLEELAAAWRRDPP
jgi:predicted dehydrogenase